MVDNVEDAPNASSQEDIDSHSTATSLEPSLFSDNDSAREEDSESGDDLRNGSKKHPISEKRQAQNLIFSDW